MIIPLIKLVKYSLPDEKKTLRGKILGEKEKNIPGKPQETVIWWW